MKTLGVLLSAAAFAGVFGAPPFTEVSKDSAVAATAAGQVTGGLTAPISQAAPARPAEAAAPVRPAAVKPASSVSPAGSGRAATRAEARCRGAQIVHEVFLRRFGGSPVVGQIRIRKDSCSRYWAEVTMYDRVPANAQATAYLTRYAADGNVSRWSCADGGTQSVVPGGRTCRSPKVGSAGDAATFIASAQELHDGGGGYARVSWGQTVRTR